MANAMRTTIVLFLYADNKSEAESKAENALYDNYNCEFDYCKFLDWSMFDETETFEPSVLRYSTIQGKHLLNKALKEEDAEIRNELFVKLSEKDIEVQFPDKNKIWVALIDCHS